MQFRLRKTTRAPAVVYVSKSQSALAGGQGDGKVHDLQYWLDSGFLTLPQK